jgi:hypothetical protein
MSLLDKLNTFLPADKRDVVTAGAGMVALLAGRKLTALALFGKGMAGLERTWREKHPDFAGGLTDRWDEALKFYEATHRDPTNRKLHIVGIPFIVAGTAGLLLFPAYRPMWGASAAAFVGGWILNFIGHGVYEKNAPAFQDDPLSFIAGPVWDFRQVFRKKDATAPAPATEPDNDWTKAPASA